MKIKAKRLEDGRIQRLEAEGEVKEILIDAPSLSPNSEIISICFKSYNSSGVIELSAKEAEQLSSTLSSKVKLIKEVKIFKSVK